MTDTSALLDTAALASEFWKQRRAGAVHIQIRDCDGQPVIDLRRHFAAKAAMRQPPRQVAIGINMACAAASDLGLFDTDGTS